MKSSLMFASLILFCCFAGCDSNGKSDPSTENTTVSTSVNKTYLLTEEPESPMPVGQARQATTDQQDVTIIGNIGGSTKPFIDGIAAFTIVDTAIQSCAEEEGCPTPWDYCCTQDQVKNNIATIKIVDPQGKPVTQSAKELLGVSELNTVIVQGTAERDEQGNLTVAANKVFIKR